MPKSKPPRKPRGTPQHRRDLQTMEKPMPSIAERNMDRLARDPGVRGTRMGMAARRVLPPKVALPVAAGAAGLLTYRKTKRDQAAGEQSVKKSMPSLAGRGLFPHLERASQRVDAIQSQARAVASLKPAKADLAIAGTAGLGVLALSRRKKEVGKLARTQDGTNVRRLQPRHPSGRFVSHTNDLMVIHPRYSTKRRAPRDSRLQCWGKGKDGAAQTYLGKADTSPLAQSMLASGPRRGRRLA